MAVSVLQRLTAAAPAGLRLTQPLARGGLARIFGPPPFNPAAAPGDPGLFGPGSASWQVISEPAAIVGGIRSLLVQLLHPLATAGVVDHSGFRDDPLDRLHRTSAYVSTTTFGSTPEAFGVAAAVRRAHRRVAGTAPDGRSYRAGDPELLAWVSVALTSSFLATDRSYAPAPVSAAVADQFVAEQARAAALLDPRVDLDALAGDAEALVALRTGTLPLPLVDEGVLPMSTAQLDTYLTQQRPGLGLNHQGRQLLRFLVWPDLAAPLRAAYLPLLSGALASLEPWQRRQLGLRLGPAATAWRVQTRTLLAALRIGAGISPALAMATRRAASVG
jgi:uncharacterized protein (DUF2236 family)